MKKLTPYQIKFLIGFVSGGLAIIPLLAFQVDANVLDAISNWSASYGGSAEAQTPIPVPQDTLPPVGRSDGASIAPCAAPPPKIASVPIQESPVSETAPSPVGFVPEESRPSLKQFHPPRDEQPTQSPSPSKPSLPVEILTGRIAYGRESISRSQADRMGSMSLLQICPLSPQPLLPRREKRSRIEVLSRSGRGI